MSQRGNKYNKVQSSDWCNDPGSEDKEASTQHKKSQCLSNDRIKESQSFLNSGFNELMESPNFMGEKQFNLNSENKVAKSRIKKKPQEVTKYKGRKKKRKVVKKASETFSDRQDQCTAPQKSIIRKAIKQFN